MTSAQSISAVSMRVMAALVAGLELEFGRGAAEGLAERFLAAEECDFTWEARFQERWLGSYEALDEDAVELDRVAMIGRLDDRFWVAVCLVDGDGNAHGMLGRRSFGTADAAQAAFAAQR